MTQHEGQKSVCITCLEHDSVLSLLREPTQHLLFCKLFS